jgi:hypothetical protein
MEEKDTWREQPQYKVQKPNNYFVKHWNGELSLAQSWWVNLFLLNILMVGLDAAIAETELLYDAIDSLVYLSIFIAIYVWQVVGTFRSASNYIETKAAAYEKYTLGRLAQFFLVVGILSAFGTTAPLVKDIFAVMEFEDDDVSNRYFVQLAGSTDVLLTGYINESSVDDIISAFEDDANRNALVLNSPGGILVSAFRLADWIQDNEVIVAASGQCVSACLLALASADGGLASLETELIFHTPISGVELTSPELIAELNLTYEEYYDRFEEYGVPPSLLESFKLEEFTPLTLGDAYDANIIDRIWDPSDNSFYDPSELCDSVNCFVTPVSLIERVAFNGAINNEGAPDLNSLLIETASGLNKNLPMMIDVETRWDSTIGGDMSFRFNYTLINYLVGDLDIGAVRDNMRLNIVDAACTNMDEFLTNGIPISYNYYDKNGVFIMTITVEPSHCKTKK